MGVALELAELANWVNQDLTFLSGFFAVAGAKFIHSSVAPTGTDTVTSAIIITVIMLVFYLFVSVWFVNAKAKKKSSDSKSSDFDKAIGESIDHITGALGWCVAIAWYGLNPNGYSEPGAASGVLIVAVIILCLLEFIYRKMKKGTVGYHMMNLIQTCAQGTFAWHLAMTLNTHYKEWYDVPGSNAASPNTLTYTMYLTTVAVGVFHMEIINCIAGRFAQHEDPTELAYGDSVMTMWKATPMKSSHLMLRDIVEAAWGANLFGACWAWTAGSLVFMAVFQMIRKAIPSCHAEKAVGDKYASSTVAIVSHTISWVCGQLFGDAYVAWLIGTNYFITAPVGAQRVMFFVAGLIGFILSLLLCQTRLGGCAERCFPPSAADEEEERELGLTAAE